MKRIVQTHQEGAAEALDVRPISGALGAEIHGIDLARPLGAAAVRGIRQALLDHLVTSFAPSRSRRRRVVCDLQAWLSETLASREQDVLSLR